MKQIGTIILTTLFLLLGNPAAYAQEMAERHKTIAIEPYPLAITSNKTTNLIFPYAIKSVDRGSRDVLAQKASGVENILLVKAGREAFRETNLSVITSDGKLYSFLLTYSTNPAPLNLFFTEDTLLERPGSRLPSMRHEAQMQEMAAPIAHQKRRLFGVKEQKFKMKLQLNGLYISSDVVFYQLEIHNRSHINYDIDLLRFFIKDRKKIKRTASQELELHPWYVYGDTAVVKGQSRNLLVFALPKFTIPDNKYLIIQLMEQNGGRHLQLRIQHRTIIQAQPLN